ncbi:sec-independent protein translocase protein TatA [Pseudonocardia hierapolitana]|uniref:Sec-independent protein translocase protein TatA n=2 Tax=Pseudonocardia hierapolitana TaxID=1128676 RepID=A0A561T342_9PSEU|nr:sec-independent protein translocase protein TatA [Pseudonocardia hierapolitana]
MPGGWEWLIVIGVLVLLFGAKRLPEMARSVGQSARVFKGEMKGLKKDDEAGKPAEQSADKPADPPAATPPAALPQSGNTAQNGQGVAKSAQPGHGTNTQ